MPIAKKQLLRLIRLADQLKSDRYPNCSSFARQMRKLDIEENLNVACTPKTIYRDIQTLKNDFNAPIEFDPSRNGYFLTDLSWSFPGGDTGLPEFQNQLCSDTVDNVVILCDKTLTRYARRHPLHHRQKLTVKPDNNGEIRIKRIQQSQLIPWVMHFCPHATIISPISLRRRICDISTQLLEKHCDL